MLELTIFFWKVVIVVIAIPLTFLLVYLTGILISKLTVKFCSGCQKRKKEEKTKKELLGGDII